MKLGRLTLRGARTIAKRAEPDDELDRIWREADEATLVLQRAITHLPDGERVSDMPEYADWKKKALAFTDACQAKAASISVVARGDESGHDVC